jgi:hypothetical protein
MSLPGENVRTGSSWQDSHQLTTDDRIGMYLFYHNVPLPKRATMLVSILARSLLN